MTRISIAMATYNGAKYLDEQLASFSSQTLRPDELVVCDDGSNDSTLQILETFSRSSPFPVRIYRNKETLGYAANFEKAIGLCKGSLIFLSDQDDMWLSKKIEIVVEVFESNPSTELVVVDMTLADADLKPSPHTQLGNILAAGDNSEKFCAGCCMALRSSLLDLAIPFPDQCFKHDIWLNHISVALGIRKLVRDPMQLYRRHGENASNSRLSSPSGVNQMSLHLAAGLGSVAKGWSEQIVRYETTQVRLIEKSDELERLGLIERRAEALLQLDKRIANLRTRLHLVAQSRFARLPLVLSLLRSGGYADFAGWKSALKDLVRK